MLNTIFLCLVIALPMQQNAHPEKYDVIVHAKDYLEQVGYDKETPLDDIENECPICSYSLKSEDTHTLICSHEYHTVCIQSWLAKENAAKCCPICQQPIILTQALTPPKKERKGIKRLLICFKCIA